MEQLMPQGIIKNNTAISQQILELNSRVWSGKETKEPCQNHYHSRVTVGIPNAASLKSKIKTSHCREKGGNK